MGIQINGNGDVISASDGSLTIQGADFTNLESLNVIGVTTFQSNVNIAGTLTYEDVTNVESIGVATFRDNVYVGAGLSVVGVTTVSAGSTAAPSITPTGDSNTGIFFPSADTIAFGEGGVESMRIDSSGRLLFGTSSSFTMGRTGAIQVAGGTGAGANNAFISATRFGTTSGGGELSLGASYGSNGNHGLVPNGHQLGRIQFVGSDGTQGLYGAWIKCEVDGDPGTNNMPGRLVFATNGGASAPTEQLRITSDRYVRLASGTGGIQFNGDTAAANALDDYEEGTFSPTLQGLSVAGTISYVRNNGRYTKVGNIVHIAVDIQVDAISAVPTGGLVFASLPFTSANVEGSFVYPGAVRLNGVSLPAGSLAAYAIMLNNSTIARIQTLKDNAAPGSIDGSNLATNDELQWSCTYRTA